jgi:hypothetical protein
MGWVGRTRALMGCAASRFAFASGAAVRAPGSTRAARTSSRTSRTARRGAVLERASGGCRSRARVGNAGRRVTIAHPDRAVVEPPGVECARAACRAPGSTIFRRLGRTSGGVRGAAPDRRACVERARGRRMGRP